MFIIFWEKYLVVILLYSLPRSQKWFHIWTGRGLSLGRGLLCRSGGRCELGLGWQVEGIKNIDAESLRLVEGFVDLWFGVSHIEIKLPHVWVYSYHCYVSNDQNWIKSTIPYLQCHSIRSIPLIICLSISQNHPSRLCFSLTYDIFPSPCSLCVISSELRVESLKEGNIYKTNRIISINYNTRECNRLTRWK